MQQRPPFVQQNFRMARRFSPYEPRPSSPFGFGGSVGRLPECFQMHQQMRLNSPARGPPPPMVSLPSRAPPPPRVTPPPIAITPPLSSSPAYFRPTFSLRSPRFSASSEPMIIQDQQRNVNPPFQNCMTPPKIHSLISPPLPLHNNHTPFQFPMPRSQTRYLKPSSFSNSPSLPCQIRPDLSLHPNHSQVKLERDRALRAACVESLIRVIKNTGEGPSAPKVSPSKIENDLKVKNHTVAKKRDSEGEEFYNKEEAADVAKALADGLDLIHSPPKCPSSSVSSDDQTSPSNLASVIVSGGRPRMSMGYSTQKRKLETKDPMKPMKPIALIVLSDDEEVPEPENKKDEPENNNSEPDNKKAKLYSKIAGGRMSIQHSLSNEKNKNDLSELARLFSERLPVDAVDIQNHMDTLNVGLEFLEEPHSLLKTLDEVMSDNLSFCRPKRLRLNAKSLYIHSKLGKLDKVLAMLVEGINPIDKIDIEGGKTPLHGAASKGHLEILVSLSYKAAGQIDVVDKFGRTPFFIAVEKQQLKAAQFLQKSGSSLRSKNTEGMTVVHVAAHKGYSEILRWLVKFNLDVNEQDNGKWTALMWAAEDANINTLKFLISRGANVSLRDKEMNICLHWAAMSGSVEVCECLLNERSDVNAVNMYGDTPLHISARENNHLVVRLLLLRGADTNIHNRENKLSLDVCTPNSKCHNAVRVKHTIGQNITHRPYESDISRGKERIAISAVNEVDDEPVPINFTYVQESIESTTVTVRRDLHSVKGCRCVDDCLKTNCDCIQWNEGSRCWYANNLVDVALFEIDQPVLVECTQLCRCWSYCNNRLVQHGSSFPLQIYKTKRIGWGLRTLVTIPKGSFVLKYVGELISDEEAERRADDSYLFDLDTKDMDGDEFVNCIDANMFGNSGRFVNHSCKGNMIPVRVFTDHRDWGYPEIAFFTKIDINPYEELTFDYGDKFWEIKKLNGLCCRCGYSGCKYR